MNEYVFEQMQTGLEASFSQTITADMMDCFLDMTGDENPLHCSDEFAIAQGYPGRVVYGMLSSSLYSTLVGMYLPGKYALLQSVDIKMLKPVYVGDALTVTGSVVETHESLQVVILKASIRNQDGSRVSKARIQVGFSER